MKIVPVASLAAVTAPNAMPNTEPRVQKMITQTSTDRVEEIPQETKPEEPSSTVNADAKDAKEETKPLGPQFAALAKQRRELQVKEKQLADREKALESKPASDDLIAKLKAQPLSVLQEHGITYDQLTEAILNSAAPNPEVNQLKAELKALKEGVDKTFVDRDQLAKQQALTEMRKEAVILSKNDNYELVRETNSIPEVVDLIDRTFTESGEILDVSEAMKLVEDELISEAKKIANLKKVKGLMNPERPQPTPQLRQQPTMKTLTNRDNASPVISRRARAIAAALGQLRK